MRAEILHYPRMRSTPTDGTLETVQAVDIEEQRTEADHALVAAARDGDRAAFGRLYAKYSRMIHGILLARVPQRDVDDLVHDVFILAMRRLETLREAGAFGGWLAMIARI